MSPHVINRCRAALSGRPGQAESPPLHVVVVASIAFLAAACSSEPKAPPSSQPAPSTSQRHAIGQMPTIDMNALLAHTRTLSSDEYEGRAPGTKGEELTVA